MGEQPLKCGVAGAGVFGGYHANKLAAAGVLTAIYDADIARAEARAAEHGASAYSDLSAFLADVDACVVATPATTHYEVGYAALRDGCHALVEKPLALTLGDADALIAEAAARGLILQTGHQERYVAGRLGLLNRQGISHVRSRRLNKPSGRAGDVSVVFDLMIHDLDLLAALTGTAEAEVVSCDARGPSDAADYVRASLRIGAIEADLSASRVAESALRDLDLTLPDGRIHLDFLTRTVTNDTGKAMAAEMGDGAPPALADPLGYGTGLFLAAVRGGPSPQVSGEAGRAALKLALTIENAVKDVL